MKRNEKSPTAVRTYVVGRFQLKKKGNTDTGKKYHYFNALVWALQLSISTNVIVAKRRPKP